MLPPSTTLLEISDTYTLPPQYETARSGGFNLGELVKRLSEAPIVELQRNVSYGLQEIARVPVIDRLDNVSESRSRFWTLDSYRALGHLVRYLQNKSRYSSTLQSVLCDLKAVVDVNTSLALTGLNQQR
jgi:hypothetical protein